MIPLLPAVLAAGAGTLGLARARRRAPLKRVLNRAKPPTTGLGQQFAKLDARWQALVQRRIDPLLMGRRRAAELARLGDALRELPPAERDANRMLLLGGLALPLLALAPITGGLTLAPVLALGLYSLLPFAREVWRIAVGERRLSVMHLLFAYLLTLWLGGWFMAAAVGVVFAGVAHKLQLLTQLVVRHNLSDLLETPPERVWVIHDGVELEIAFQALAKGDILVLGAGQPVPVDGTIVAGLASIDQHRLTGESQPATKGVGDGVSAATLVLTGRIQVRVERTGRETTAARIAAVLELTVEQQEVRIGDQFDRLEQTRTPMLIGGALGWLLGGPATAIALLGCNYLGMLISASIAPITSPRPV